MRKEGWYWISIDEERGFDEVAYWCPARGWLWDGCWQGSDAIFSVKVDERRIVREAECADLLSRLRKAEDDAKRYRWLRDEADEFDINDFFMCSKISEKRDKFADEAMDHEAS